MMKSETTVYVDCDDCGFRIIVGDGRIASIPFNASDAMTAEEAAGMTLAEHYGWTFDMEGEEILCPNCCSK